jgi:hypothetical protein
MKQNISTEATLVLLNTLLNEAGVSARQHYETILPRRSLRRNRRGKAKGKRRDAFRFRTTKVPGKPADSDATPEGRSELDRWRSEEPRAFFVVLNKKHKSFKFGAVLLNVPWCIVNNFLALPAMIV